MLKINRTTSNNPSYHFYYNDIYMGDADMDENGLFVFSFTEKQQENWTYEILEIIYEKLDELNKQENH